MSGKEIEAKVREALAPFVDQTLTLDTMRAMQEALDEVAAAIPLPFSIAAVRFDPPRGVVGVSIREEMAVPLPSAAYPVTITVGAPK